MDVEDVEVGENMDFEDGELPDSDDGGGLSLHPGSDDGEISDSSDELHNPITSSADKTSASRKAKDCKTSAQNSIDKRPPQANVNSVKKSVGLDKRLPHANVKDVNKSAGLDKRPPQANVKDVKRSSQGSFANKSKPVVKEADKQARSSVEKQPTPANVKKVEKSARTSVHSKPKDETVKELEKQVRVSVDKPSVQTVEIQPKAFVDRGRSLHVNEVTDSVQNQKPDKDSVDESRHIEHVKDKEVEVEAIFEVEINLNKEDGVVEKEVEEIKAKEELEDGEEEEEEQHEFEIIDQVESEEEGGDESRDKEEEDNGSSSGTDIDDSLIHNLLEEGVDKDKKRSDQDKSGEQEFPLDGEPLLKNKLVMEEIESDPFAILPEGWVCATHNSGMPVYLHRETRVCTMARPYYLGQASTRSHDIPISAIPCLQYRTQLERRKQSSADTNGTLTGGKPSEEISNANQPTVKVEGNVASDTNIIPVENQEMIPPPSSSSNVISSLDSNKQVGPLPTPIPTTNISPVKPSSTCPYSSSSSSLSYSQGKVQQQQLDIPPTHQTSHPTFHSPLESTQHNPLTIVAPIDNHTQSDSQSKLLPPSSQQQNPNPCPTTTHKMWMVNQDSSAKSPSQKEPEELHIGNTTSFNDEMAQIEPNSQLSTSHCNNNTTTDKTQMASCPFSLGEGEEEEAENISVKPDETNSFLNSSEMNDVDMFLDCYGDLDNISSGLVVAEEASKDGGESSELVTSNTSKLSAIKRKIEDLRRVAKQRKMMDGSAKPIKNPNDNNIAIQSVYQWAQDNLLKKNIAEIKVKTAAEKEKDSTLNAIAVYQYCSQLFQFKTLVVKKYRTWKERRRNVMEQNRQRATTVPTLPGATKFITFPVVDHSKQYTAGGPNEPKKEFVLNPTGKSYLCILHEYLQRTLKLKPHYMFKELENAKTPYSVTVLINNVEYGTGLASSKKIAKQEAAREALKVLIPDLEEKVEDKVKAKKDSDFSFFDEVQVEDPRVDQLCAKVGQPNPFQILKQCLRRNFGMSMDVYDMKSTQLSNQRCEFSLTVGKHSASVVAKNKKDGKQLASQAILAKLHPHVPSWGSMLRLYATGVEKPMEKAEEMNEIKTQLPNKHVLDSLKQEMKKLHQLKEAIKCKGKMMIATNDLPSRLASGIDI